MGAQPVIPVEIQQLAQEIADRQAGSMQNQLFELGQLMAQSRNVRPQTPARFTPNYLAACPIDKALQLVGRREDRVGVMVINLNATLGNRISIGSDPNISAGGSTTFPIPGGGTEISRIWIPALSDVWAISATANHEMAWIVFEWDA